MNTKVLQREWFSNVKADILAGTLVALALIPEAIAFSLIAGVDPKVGLYASFLIAIITSFLGGRPGLISAATAPMALLMINLVRDHGIEYLFAATIFTGILQIICGWLKLGRQMKYVPRAVMIGFVNALGISIFRAQLPQVIGETIPWQVYPLVALTLAIIYILPRFTKAVPSPLVAIIIVTIISIFAGITVPTVGDTGEIPSTLPFFQLPQVPFNLETLGIIFPYVLSMTFVSLVNTWLVVSLVDEFTDTPSNKNREAVGQGIANIATGFLGGMAGCAMAGQSVINIKSGGRTRLSTFCAGLVLILLILVAGDWVRQIPMAALVGVMVMVSIGTFNWNSLRTINLVPRTETAVMVTTVFVTLLTRNLGMGVLVGIVLSAVFFSRDIARVVFVDSVISADQTYRTYNIAGQLFFLSVDEFLEAFNFQESLQRVKIDLSHAHIWDQSAVNAIDKVVIKFRRNGAEVDVVGMNEASATLLNKLAVYDKSVTADN
ncbi:MULTISPECIES: SulP family inorganic anion transporter [unclassified Anabaena]|uniref:SulP family inorganic anion transporter n=1 Tax=unclassified Anabaena TaxID=2619674 RepID=UPI0039C6DB22